MRDGAVGGAVGPTDGRGPAGRRWLPYLVLVVIAGLVVAGLAWSRHGGVDTERDAAARAVSGLATGLSLDRFVEVIGRRPEITRATGPFEEALWINDVYAVQAVIGPFGEVRGYSVTTRSARFTPPVDALGGGALGVTALSRFVPFADPAPLADGVGITAHGMWWYSEALPASGATNERAIVLTTSDASEVGVTDTTPDVADQLALPQGEPSQTVPRHGPLSAVASGSRLASARGQLIPTTYSIIGPRLTLEQLPEDFRFGPTHDDVLAVLPRR